MLKIRITFTNTEKGNEELDDIIELLEDNKIFEIINKSKIYKGRGESKYNNIYVDIDYK